MDSEIQSPVDDDLLTLANLDNFGASGTHLLPIPTNRPRFLLHQIVQSDNR